MRTRSVIALASFAMLASACAGPRDTLEIGSKDIPVDIVLGNQSSGFPVPPGAGPVDGFPGFVGPPAPDPDPGVPPPPAPPPQACPRANPLDASKLVADRSAPLPPVPATYRFRNHGQTTKQGIEIEYPPEQTRTVRNVRTTATGFDFEVAATLVETTTTTSYRVVQDPQVFDRGLYLMQTVTEYPNGDLEAFTPEQGLLIMPFPPPELGTNLEDELDRYRGGEYRSAETDPISQTTMFLHARTIGKERVDACGEWVDAFDVEVIQGKIVSPTKNIDFTGHVFVATQYGGLVVQDDLAFTGTEDFAPFQNANRATINIVPRAPIER